MIKRFKPRKLFCKIEFRNLAFSVLRIYKICEIDSVLLKMKAKHMLKEYSTKQHQQKTDEL